jgi:hypothetical protein
MFFDSLAVIKLGSTGYCTVSESLHIFPSNTKTFVSCTVILHWGFKNPIHFKKKN